MVKVRKRLKNQIEKRYNQRCPKCNREIDLNKPYTFFQKWKNKKAMQITEKAMGGIPKEMPEMKDYYCDCGLHITFIKDKGEWKWITAS